MKHTKHTKHTIYEYMKGFGYSMIIFKNSLTRKYIEQIIFHVGSPNLKINKSKTLLFKNNNRLFKCFWYWVSILRFIWK